MPRTIWNSWFKGWTRSKVDQLEYDAAAGRQAVLEKELRPFLESFKEKLATVLAYKPMDQWPTEAKAAFHYAQREYPHAAELYRTLNQQATANYHSYSHSHANQPGTTHAPAKEQPASR